MRITAIELQYEDIMWFGIDNNNHIWKCSGICLYKQRKYREPFKLLYE